MFRFVRPTAFAVFVYSLVAVWLGVVAPAHASWPLTSDGDVLLGFTAPYLRAGQQTVHMGVDLATAPSASVLSPVDGEVSFVGRVPAAEGSMLAVTLRTEDGLLVSLMPLVSTQLTTGCRLAVGDSVGPVAPTGDISSAESHLHIGARRGERYVDPMPVLGCSPVEPITDTVPEPDVADVQPEQASAVPAEPAIPVVERGVGSAAAANTVETSPVRAPTESGGTATLDEAGRDTAGSTARPVVEDSVSHVNATARIEDRGDPAVTDAQGFRSAHARPVAHKVAFDSWDNVPAVCALLGAGVLALWPLWRKKGQLVPDVRPEINDVAVAVSR